MHWVQVEHRSALTSQQSIGLILLSLSTNLIKKLSAQISNHLPSVPVRPGITLSHSLYLPTRFLLVFTPCTTWVDKDHLTGRTTITSLQVHIYTRQLFGYGTAVIEKTLSGYQGSITLYILGGGK